MRQSGEPRERPTVAADAATALKASILELVAALAFALLAAAVLFPVLAKPRPQLTVRCIANLKQIVLAALMYAEDNDGRLPDAARWPRQLLPYVHHRELYRCEKDHSGAAVSYAMDSAYSGRRTDEYTRAAERVLFVDADAAGRPVARHNGGCYCAYLDGHVKWVAGVPKLDGAPAVPEPPAIPGVWDRIVTAAKGAGRRLLRGVRALAIYCWLWIPPLWAGIRAARRRARLRAAA